MTWHVDAACRGKTPFFYKPAFEPIALSICHSCPVQTTCLTEAMAYETWRDRHGVIGGLTAEGRDKLARRRARRAS